MVDTKAATEHGTCDQCAEGGKRLFYVNPNDPDGAWICQDCIDFHEAALGVAARAIATEIGSAWSGDEAMCRRFAEVAVKAYCEHEPYLVGGAERES